MDEDDTHVLLAFCANLGALWIQAVYPRGDTGTDKVQKSGKEINSRSSLNFGQGRFMAVTHVIFWLSCRE